jgi:hypothetical protein
MQSMFGGGLAWVVYPAAAAAAAAAALVPKHLHDVLDALVHTLLQLLGNVWRGIQLLRVV